jgi:hypothetical protein
MTATGIRVEQRSETLETAGSRAAAGLSRWGGVAGFVFVASVVVQNILRGAAPANDAPASKIIADYVDHRSVHLALAALFAVGVVALPTFAGTLWTRLRDGASARFVRIGVLGVAGIFTLFAITVALDVALTAYVHMGDPSPDVVKGLWVLHNATFTMLFASLAIATFGLSHAAVAGKLIGPRWKTVGVVAPLALLVPVLAAPATVEGSPVLALGALGFAGWLAFVCRSSYALMREAS